MKIVAPAGNMERFYAAVKAGAQEIYMGLKGFGAIYPVGSCPCR